MGCFFLPRLLLTFFMQEPIKGAWVSGALVSLLGGLNTATTVSQAGNTNYGNVAFSLDSKESLTDDEAAANDIELKGEYDLLVFLLLR